MTKKTYLYLLFSLLAIIIVTLIIVRNTKTTTPNSFFSNTIPLLDQKGQNQVEKPTIVYQKTNTPQQVNIKNIQNQVDRKLSGLEKDKIISLLPLRIDDFKTSTPLITTINLYSLSTDPPESLRFEIYNVNFNNLNITGNDAIAFKDSFIEVKKILLTKKVNLKNLQIIYGNRQYIQDTATSWVNSFKLLD